MEHIQCMTKLTWRTETLCELLRDQLHPLRAFVALSEYSLVLRQAQHDRRDHPVR